jgi:hemerythrin superfamily protein
MGTTRLDVVDLLTEQHTHIRELFTELGLADNPTARQDKFEELRRFLAVHETAEELVTHPVARLADGNDVVDARLEEEDEAKRLLAELDRTDTEDPKWRDKVEQLQTAVLAHAEAEEREEFPLLRAESDPETRERMARALKAVEAIAPTHPHPSAGSSATVNLLVGPLASLIDRTRDAVGAVLKQD